MSISDFEPDPDILAAGEFELGTSDEGRLFANAVEADEFSDDIHNDVEGLLLLGYLTTNATIFGHTFVLKTLTRGERLAVTQFVREYEDSLGIGQALETASLALAIINVDGRPLSIPLGDADRSPATTLVRNYSKISQWYDPVLDSLYMEYQELQQRMTAAFIGLQGKLTAGRRTSQP